MARGLAASKHNATITSQMCDHSWKQGIDETVQQQLGICFPMKGCNLYKFIINRIIPSHVIKTLCDLDPMDNNQECIRLTLSAVLLTDSMMTEVTHTYSSYLFLSLSLRLCVFFFPGLGVQLFVFLCGQMELQQHSFYVRSFENLLLLPEKRAHWAGGFSLPRGAQTKICTSWT